MAVETLQGSVTKDHMLPTFTAPAYDAMEGRWKICRDVYRGTEALREKANLDEYFPKGAAETTDEQLARAMRAVCFPMLKETVKGLVGLGLRKDPVLQDDVPLTIRNLCENIDGAGTHISVFARRLFSEAMLKGHAGILIDVPKVATTKKLTIRQEKALGLRPYCVLIKPEQIINWRTQVINGTVTLTLLVLSEVVDVPMGDFATVELTKYRVFRRDPLTGVIQYEIWTQVSDDKDPELDEDGELRGVTVIPFVVHYSGEKIAPLQSIPPLIDLAYTNIQHTQVQSGHLTSLAAAGSPILVTKGRIQGGMASNDPNRPGASGFSEDNPATAGGAGVPSGPALVVGNNIGIDLPADANADVFYVEHAGQALSASSKELQDIETRGAAQGLAMLQRSTRAAQAAETERLQRGEKDASMISSVRNLKDCLETMLAFLALFLGEADGGSIEVDEEFQDVVMDTARITALVQAQIAGTISRETFWDLLISGGVLPEDFDKEAELRRLTQASNVTLDGSGDGGTPPKAGAGAGADTGGAGGAE
jgi:hypothetical protein